jgi:hypothetical protein
MLRFYARIHLIYGGRIFTIVGSGRTIAIAATVDRELGQAYARKASPAVEARDAADVQTAPYPASAQWLLIGYSGFAAAFAGVTILRALDPVARFFDLPRRLWFSVTGRVLFSRFK